MRTGGWSRERNAVSPALIQSWRVRRFLAGSAETVDKNYNKWEDFNLGVIVRPDDSAEITHLLHVWGSGDESALERLTPLVYDELRRIARQYSSVQGLSPSANAT